MQTEHEDQVTEDQDVAAATEVEQVDEQPVDNCDSPDTDAADEPETFDRDYVERLRRENGRYRQRAQRADDYAQRLHVEIVRATGRLADPSDLQLDEAHLDDPDALNAAVDELLTRKPHLASRRPTGEIGQGASPPAASSVDLAALLRRRAR